MRVLAGCAVACLLASLGMSGDGGPVFIGQADDDSITVGGTAGGGASPASPSATPFTYSRFWYERCSGTGLQLWCSDGDLASRVCSDGTTATAPLFRRSIDPTTGEGTGPWERVDAGGCPEDAAAPVLTEEEFARLPLQPSPVHLEPGTGQALVHYGVIAHTDPTPQTLTTTLLGVPIVVTATPTSWTWDFGDTDPITTTDPGRPYPDMTGLHPYDTPGTYTLILTTTWSGTYQVNGAGPAIPVTGTATTTSAPQTITVTTAHPQLVTNP